MFPQKLSDIFHRERYSIGSLLLPRLVNKLFDPKIFCKFVEISKFRDDGANRFIFRFSLIFLLGVFVFHHLPELVFGFVYFWRVWKI